MSVISCAIFVILCCCLFSIKANGATLCARQGEVRCMANPCMFSKCLAYPEATCEANYCGGCNADFYLNGVQLLSADCQIETNSQLDKSTSFQQKKASLKEKIPAIGQGNDISRLRQLPRSLPSVDLIKAPFLGNGPTLLKYDTENEGRGSPSGSRGGRLRGQAPRRGSGRPQNRGRGPTSGQQFPPSFPRGVPRHQQNSQRASSSRPNQGENRRPSWFRNFFRGLFGSSRRRG